MILSFKQAMNGKPNFFIEKIWFGLCKKGINLTESRDYRILFYQKFNRDWDEWDWPDEDVGMKIHTIRQDVNYRWGADTDIHFVINSRSKDYFQFAPVVKCLSVQKIEIKYIDPHKNRGWVYINGHLISENNLLQLSINDGFDSINDFFAFFNKDFTGKIIHWTDLKY